MTAHVADAGLCARLLGIACLAALLSACTPLPTPNLAAPQPTVVKSAAVTQRPVVLRKTGVYPSIGAPLTSANSQMSNEDAKTLQAKLTALGKLRQSGAVTEAEYERKLAELRKIGADIAAQGLEPATN